MLVGEGHMLVTYMPKRKGGSHNTRKKAVPVWSSKSPVLP